MSLSLMLLISEKEGGWVTASGRGVQHKKQTVEDSFQLSLSALHRGDLFKDPGREWVVSWGGPGGDTPPRLGISYCHSVSRQPRVRLSYTVAKGWTEERTPVDYVIDLTTTPCYFGGRRRWFLCPRAGCGRRVAKLYKPPGATYFLCRHCHQLTYAGRQQHRNGSYESFGRFDLYRRRAEQARSQRQKARWLLRLFEADERIQAYMKAYDARFWKRLNNLKRAASLTNDKV